MEIKINREIRDYTEKVFFGLSLRQLIFSALACAVAVAFYFSLKPYFGIETLSWVCILGAAPFTVLGFVNYHGMTAERLLQAVIRSELMRGRKLRYQPRNHYYELFLPVIKRSREQSKEKKKETETARENRTNREMEACR